MIYFLAQESEPPEIEKLSLKHLPKSDHKSPIELELGQLENRLRTVQLALEILTGACATLPDPVIQTAGTENDDDENEGQLLVAIDETQVLNFLRRGCGYG